MRPPRILFPFFVKHPHIQPGIRPENKMALRRTATRCVREFTHVSKTPKRTFKKSPKKKQLNNHSKILLFRARRSFFSVLAEEHVGRLYDKSSIIICRNWSKCSEMSPRAITRNSSFNAMVWSSRISLVLTSRKLYPKDESLTRLVSTILIFEKFMI